MDQLTNICGFIPIKRVVLFKSFLFPDPHVINKHIQRLALKLAGNLLCGLKLGKISLNPYSLDAILHGQTFRLAAGDYPDLITGLWHTSDKCIA